MTVQRRTASTTTTMSSSNRSPPSYYGPPPGGYTPSPNERGRGMRDVSNYRIPRREDAERSRYEYDSQQDNYAGYQDPRDPYYYSSSSYPPRDEYGRSYPPPSERGRQEPPPRHHDHQQGLDTHRDSDYNRRPVDSRWKRYNYVRPRTPDRHSPRNVRSRTASLTDEEEGEERERQRDEEAPNNGGSSHETSTTTAASATVAENDRDEWDLSDDDEPEPPAAPAKPANNEIAPVISSASLDITQSMSHVGSPSPIVSTPTIRSMSPVRSTPPVRLTVASRPTAGEQDASSDTPAESESPQAIPSSSLVASAAVEIPFFYHETEGDPMAFCCAKCNCDPKEREEYSEIPSQAFPGDYYHRHCCHKIKAVEVKNNWMPPVREVTEKIDEFYAGRHRHIIPKPVIISKREVKRVNGNKQMQVKNDEQIETALSLLSTSQPYLDIQKQFKCTVDNVVKEDLRPAVVLDVFAGVGAALVVLKRLKIAMKTVIHVEHDRIASHVVKYHHDKEINPDAADDGIEHIYMSKFEDLESNIDQIIEDNGPIDIIVGGPPCTDYSGINANAQGPEGAQGQFLPRFADFIQNVRAKQPGHRLYFLVENVVFTDSDRLVNYNMIEKKLGVVETVHDALYFSPCARKRSFWLNVPLTDCTRGYDEAVAIKPSSCMEDEWQFPGESDREFAKVATFLASKGRLDDEPRMIRIKPLPDGKYEKSYFSALERERMLGFPEGYVQRGVEHLFNELLTKGLTIPEPDESEPETLWKNQLHPRYFCYSGEPFRFELAYDESRVESGDVPCYVRLLMSPPQVTKTRSHFNAEDYSKHLLGNSFSIPVVEYLLTRLSEVFATREYEGFDYKYRWETDETG